MPRWGWSQPRLGKWRNIQKSAKRCPNNWHFAHNYWKCKAKCGVHAVCCKPGLEVRVITVVELNVLEQTLLACPSGRTIQIVSVKKIKHLEQSDSIWISTWTWIFFPENSHFRLHLAMISLSLWQENKAKHWHAFTKKHEWEKKFYVHEVKVNRLECRFIESLHNTAN